MAKALSTVMSPRFDGFRVCLLKELWRLLEGFCFGVKRFGALGGKMFEVFEATEALGFEVSGFRTPRLLSSRIRFPGLLPQNCRATFTWAYYVGTYQNYETCLPVPVLRVLLLGVHEGRLHLKKPSRYGCHMVVDQNSCSLTLNPNPKWTSWQIPLYFPQRPTGTQPKDFSLDQPPYEP